MQPKLEHAAEWTSMKIEDYTVTVAYKVFELLEKKHFFKVPEAIQEQVVQEVRAEVDRLIPKAGSGKKK